MFLNTLYERLDRTLAASHYFWMCNRWLVFRFDTLGALSILLATIGSLMAGASAGLAGVVIVQAQQYVRGVRVMFSSLGAWHQLNLLVLQLYWSIRFWTDLEQSCESHPKYCLNASTNSLFLPSQLGGTHSRIPQSSSRTPWGYPVESPICFMAIRCGRHSDGQEPRDQILSRA